jgi:hypothetical protein
VAALDRETGFEPVSAPDPTAPWADLRTRCRLVGTTSCTELVITITGEMWLRCGRLRRRTPLLAAVPDHVA